MSEFLAALLGAVVGAFGSYFVQRALAKEDHAVQSRLAVEDHRRALVLRSLSDLQSAVHSVSFRIGDLVRALALRTPDEFGAIVRQIVEGASATQATKIIVQGWHPQAATAVTDWSNRVIEFAQSVWDAYESGDSSNEMQLAYESAMSRLDDNDDFGMGTAMNVIAEAIKVEVDQTMAHE